MTIETTDLNTEQRSSRRRTERAICLRVTRDAWVSVRALRARADTGHIAQPRDLRGSVLKSVASVVLRSSTSNPQYAHAGPGVARVRGRKGILMLPPHFCVSMTAASVSGGPEVYRTEFTHHSEQYTRLNRFVTVVAVIQ